jgi:membrane protein
MRPSDIGRLIRDAAAKYLDDNCPRLGAAIAFYMAFSLSPLALAAVAVAGFAFGEEAARGELSEKLRDTLGREGAAVVERLVAESSTSSRGIGATIVAIGVLVLGASGVFAELQGALNTIWQLPDRQEPGGIWNLARRRLLSFLLVGTTALLLLLSLVVSSLLSAISSNIGEWVAGMGSLAEVTNFLLTLGLLTVLFAMIFQWLPDTDLAWSDVWLGAAISAGLFSVGKYLIGLYLGQLAVGSAYGAAGAFVTLLAWVYWSSQILLFGAELTFIYAKRHGRGVSDSVSTTAGVGM